MNREPEGPGWSLCLGILFIIWGTLSIVTGKAGIHIAATGGQIVLMDWIGWVLLPSGIVISIVSIRSLLRGGGKPETYTDEEATRAKEELAHMHFKEHGCWPNDIAEAKKIFDKYDGSFFHMAREGEYDIYKKFEVPKSIERTWFYELKKDIIENLHSEKNEKEIVQLFSRYSTKISKIEIEDDLLFMLEFAKNNQNKFDSYTNVRLIESILNFINSITIFGNGYNQTAINESLGLLRKVTEAPFWVSDAYEENGVFPDYITESKIMNEYIETLCIGKMNCSL